MERPVKTFGYELKAKRPRALEKKIKACLAEVVSWGYLITDIKHIALDKRIQILIDGVFVGKKTLINYVYCKQILKQFNVPENFSIEPERVIKEWKELRK